MKKFSLETEWSCTTNACRNDAVDKAANKQLVDTSKSASDAFSEASINCRDSTKTTCGVKTQ